MQTRPVFEPPYTPATGHTYDREKMIHEMLSMSIADVWEKARSEWSLFEVYDDTCKTHCLCGHEITERCVLRNHKTDHLALVGNSCAKQFMPRESETTTSAMFASIKRVKKSPEKSLHNHIVSLARQKRRITQRAEDWYNHVRTKRKKTSEENRYHAIINRRILQEDAEDTVADRFCMPFGGAWKLNDMLLLWAHENGRLTQAEVEYYTSNYYNPFVTDGQKPIKRRIEELTLPQPFTVDEETLRKALTRRLIPPADFEFYLSAAQTKFFTDTQARIKWRVEDLCRLDGLWGERPYLCT
jgi:hypothetical protein